MNIDLIYNEDNVPDKESSTPDTDDEQTPRVSEATADTQKARGEVQRPSRLRKVPENLKDYVLNSVGENVVNCLTLKPF